MHVFVVVRETHLRTQIELFVIGQPTARAPLPIAGAKDELRPLVVGPGPRRHVQAKAAIEHVLRRIAQHDPVRVVMPLCASQALHKGTVIEP